MYKLISLVLTIDSQDNTLNGFQNAITSSTKPCYQ